ncbi:hypothetical protein SAMN05216207_10615 [Pseudonocardia ammonioxydans]|uniref:Lipoprotein n=1 Tax=Pseudonocardia ammonioxydans TaxID=260086 RepID=A0A1I5HBV1_PSUAM|nr:hypothetical protein SAMN05216207_10615 [Pseudonocardia ammonioxydans]
MFGNVWRGRAVRCGLLLTGLVAVLLAVACASHAPDLHITDSAKSVSTSHDHGPSCHEAGPHDVASVSSRTDRAVPDVDGPPVVLPAVASAAAHQSVGPTSMHGRLVPTGGRSHLVLAQIART